MALGEGSSVKLGGTLGVGRPWGRPHPSRPKLDLGRPPRKGFRSISLKAWEELVLQNYTLSFLCIMKHTRGRPATATSESP